MATVGQRGVKRRRFFIVGPAFPNNLVAGVVLRFGPVGPALFGVVRFFEDVANFDFAFGVWGWGFGEVGDGGGGGVGVEDNLVVGADPAVVPLDDGGGLLPAGLVLAALVGTVGGDDVSACAGHDGAVVVPAIGPASATGRAVCWVVYVSAVTGVFATHVEDTSERVYACVFGHGHGGTGCGEGRWKEF